jgi:site-specific DNA recombinase
VILYGLFHPATSLPHTSLTSPQVNKTYFSYVRVSTVRQGQTGTSLVEQSAAIRRYAERYGLSISTEYKEQETAAKRGRPVFADMLRELRAGRAAGVIMHKIDRSARNLKDWADLGEMIDQGVEVHFANESLDLHSRGGRLSADIQAVVAADYIRNLREETKKGIYGRLKQGLYPMPAPIGYADRGQGQPKVPDPVQAPLVREAFELYATGQYGLRALTEKLSEMGLTARNRGVLRINPLHDMLRNPFYTGLIRIKKTGECFPGSHEPIITRTLFERVQGILAGKRVEITRRHEFLFRRHMTCEPCRYTLIPELQKRHVYYRCQTKVCPQKTVREEVAESAFVDILKQLRFDAWEQQFFHTRLETDEQRVAQSEDARIKGLRLRLSQVSDRLSKLTDAYLERIVDRDVYVNKKNSLLEEEQGIKEKLNGSDSEAEALRRVRGFLELANDAYLSYQSAIFPERRDLVKTVTSNFTVREKIVIPKLHYVFQLVAEREKSKDGRPPRDTARTLSPFLNQLIDYFREHEFVTSTNKVAETNGVFREGKVA